MIGFINTFTVSLRLHLYFYRLEFDEFAVGLIEVLANLVSGYHSKLFIKFCC